MNKKILLLFLVIALASTEELYKRVIHSTDPDALCIDGTPPVLYYHEGAEKNKFMVFFIGGGACGGMTL